MIELHKIKHTLIHLVNLFVDLLQNTIITKFNNSNHRINIAYIYHNQ